jgi:hypothetical protein
MTGIDRNMDGAVRGLAAAYKSLKLYPETSPIPRDAVASACASLSAALGDDRPVVSLRVERDGFSSMGEPAGAGAPGAADLAGVLRAHGVAELDLLPGVDVEDLMVLLRVLGKDPAAVRATGGVGAELATAGVERARVADVALTVTGVRIEADDVDADAFLRELAADPDKLSSWLGAAVKGDTGSLADGVAELARVAGPGGGRLAGSLASAFRQLDPDGRDAFLSMAMEPGAAQGVAASALGGIGASELAESLIGGSFGGNMMALSNAMVRLPLAERLGEVMKTVQDMLPVMGHTARETEFLQHMVEVRTGAAVDGPIVGAEPDLAAIARDVTYGIPDLGAKRDEVAVARRESAKRSVEMMLTLLDQQKEFGQYCRALDRTAALVPGIVRSGDLQLASRVLAEIQARAVRAASAWPELNERIDATLASATGPQTMGPLLEALAADPAASAAAGDLVRRGGEPAQTALIEAALSHADHHYLEVAERLVGRRSTDILCALAPSVQWFQVGVVAARLIDAGGPRCLAAVDQLANRPDEQSRREAASALGALPDPEAIARAARLLGDSSAEVAIVATRALGRNASPAASRALAGRLADLDVDGRDFALARELIGALSRHRDPVARDAIDRLASRRALIKRGHFAEVTDLAKRAAAVQQQGGAA